MVDKEGFAVRLIYHTLQEYFVVMRSGYETNELER